MNIDYSLSEALKTTNTEGVPQLMLLYDVMCQYKVHLKGRFEATREYLQWPDSIDPDMLLAGIGKFHVHAHKESCLYQFSPSYIPSAGMVDGEALEPLWSNLNDTSRALRVASLSHRTEGLDDQMNDSNFKKITSIGTDLCSLPFLPCLHQ